MLVAHTGDNHLDERCPHATLEEQVAWMTWVGVDAAKAGARAILNGGDVFERESTPAERRAAIEVFTSWAEHVPVITARGNHDSCLDLHFLGRLRTRFPIIVQEETGLIRFPGLDVAVLPWPRRAHLAAMMGVTSKDEIGQAAVDGLRHILDGFATQWTAGSARVLLGHVELGSATLDSGQPVMAHTDVTIAEVDLLGTGADYVALSHIHKSQTLAGRIRYAGSHRPTAFGQDDDPKGYSLVEVKRGEEPAIEHRVGPARRLVTVQAAWYGEVDGSYGESRQRVDAMMCSPDGGAPDDLVVPGASMRLVYHVEESERGAGAEAADRVRSAWLAAGAHSVKIDPRIEAVHREMRSVEITKARTDADRVRAYWASRKDQGGRTMPPPARAAQILEKLSQLEQAA